MEYRKITSSSNTLIQHLVRLKKESVYRKEKRVVLIEGKKLIIDLLAQNKVQKVFSSDSDFLNTHRCEAFHITDEIARKLSSVETPQNYFAEVRMPEYSSIVGSRIVVCDRIQDPGNLGTIIRTAFGFNWSGLILLPGCCDPYNDKALRAAKGATFCIPHKSTSWQEVQSYVDKEYTLAASNLTGAAIDVFHAPSKLLLIFGNEGSGIEIPMHIPYTTLTIPMNAELESLNVAQAAAIMLYTFRVER